MSEQSRREDPRIVQDQQVAGSQVTAELGERRVLESIIATHHQQPRLASRPWRVLRNQFGGQLEIKIRDVHL